MILIDSPEGHTDQMPGRQQSIFAASAVATPSTTVFLHDYNRALEKEAARQYFGEPVEVVGKKPSLAVFQGARQTARGERSQASSSHRQVAADTTRRGPSLWLPGASSLDASVIIPTYNEGAWLKRTVESAHQCKDRVGL